MVGGGPVRRRRATGVLVRRDHATGPEPAPHARGVPARPTSVRGCPTRSSPRPTPPIRSSAPRRCRWRCSSCWRRSRRWSGRSSCCARCSTPYQEIADALDTSAAAVRQIVSRAGTLRPRYTPAGPQHAEADRTVPGGGHHRGCAGLDGRAGA